MSVWCGSSLRWMSITWGAGRCNPSIRLYGLFMLRSTSGSMVTGSDLLIHESIIGFIDFNERLNSSGSRFFTCLLLSFKVWAMWRHRHGTIMGTSVGSQLVSLCYPPPLFGTPTLTHTNMNDLAHPPQCVCGALSRLGWANTWEVLTYRTKACCCLRNPCFLSLPLALRLPHLLTLPPTWLIKTYNVAELTFLSTPFVSLFFYITVLKMSAAKQLCVFIFWCCMLVATEVNLGQHSVAAGGGVMSSEEDLCHVCIWNRNSRMQRVSVETTLIYIAHFTLSCNWIA